MQPAENDKQPNSRELVPFFDRDTTNYIKGIALVMMFVHHFFGFPEWWGEGMSYPLMEKISAPLLCQPLKLCVPIFCFITGYLYFFNKNKSYKYSIKKITDILISYLIVFFLFAIIATVFVKYIYTLGAFILECFALKCPTIYFGWYVSFYIIVMLLLPLITKIMSKDILLIDIFLCIILIPNIFRLTAHFVNNRIIKELIENQQYWLSSVLAGYVFAKYDFFEKIKHFHLRIIKSKMINIVLMGITVLFVPLGRVALPYLSLQYKQITVVIMNMDNIYAPIFIYAVVYLCKAIDIKIVKKTLIIIGKKTLLMFLVSSNFFNNCKEIFQPILYYPQNPVLVTIWGLIICFSVSFILDKVIKRLLNRKDKLLGF